MILLTRKADFSSAHYYWNDSLSEAENHRIFGKCANRNGHGHNYTLEVTVAGEIDPVTGFVVDLKQLKDILEKEVVSVYDHRHLNFEIPDFATVIPTTENIAIAIWRRLDGKIPHAKLHRVRVYETSDLFADFYGDFLPESLSPAEPLERPFTAMDQEQTIEELLEDINHLGKSVLPQLKQERE